MGGADKVMLSVLLLLLLLPYSHLLHHHPPPSSILTHQRFSFSCGIAVVDLQPRPSPLSPSASFGTSFLLLPSPFPLLPPAVGHHWRQRPLHRPRVFNVYAATYSSRIECVRPPARIVRANRVRCRLAFNLRCFSRQ